MKFIAVLLGFMIFHVNVIAQSADLSWAKAFGGSSTDYARAVAVDDLGNIYTTGQFRQTVDFDPGAGVYNLTAVGFDVYIQKLDANGNFVWARSIGGTNDDYGQGIAIDEFGNVNVVGHYFGTCDFDPGTGVTNLTAVGQRDVFVLQLDANGNFNWAKSFGGSSWDYAYAVDTDVSGNVYITGGYQGTVDFNPDAGVSNLTSAGTIDIFIEKLDVLGNFVWARSRGNTSDDYGYGIHVSATNQVYITGQYTLSFNSNIYVEKITSSGTTVWTKSTGANSNDIGYALTTDQSGNLLITGMFSGAPDFDPGAGNTTITSAGASDIFVQKLDSMGNFIWAKAMGGVSNDEARSITTDANNNVYLTGSFSSNPADFDPGTGTSNISTVGVLDFFVEKLDSNGNFVWVKSMGSGNEDTGQSVAVDNSNNLYTTGYFSNTVDLNPGAPVLNAASNGGTDLFIQKFRQCTPIITNQALTICAGDFIMVGTSMYNSSGIYTDNLLAVNGCDSTVNTDLTVSTAITGSVTATVCNGDSVVVGTSVYYVTGVYTDVLLAQNGCDSTVTTDLTVLPAINNSEAFTICNGDSIVVGGSVYYNTGIYFDVFPAQNGCDSTVITNLTVLSEIVTSNTISFCNGDSLVVGTSVYYTSGIYTDVLTSVLYGCDSTVTTNLTVNVVDVSTTLVDSTITASAFPAIYQWLDCDNNFSVIPSQISQSFTVATTGNYAVEITQNGCTDTSTCIPVVVMLLEENTFEGNLKIYPNPAWDKVYVDRSDQELTINIYNLVGDIVLQKDLTTNENSIDISSLQGGVYLITLKGNDSFFKFKLTKK